jgi:hypothetical protein
VLWSRGSEYLSGRIGAERLAGQVITGYGVGSGAAATANLDVFATATIVLIAGKVSHIEHQLRVFPDFFEGLGAEITGRYREIATGQNIGVNINQTD